MPEVFDGGYYAIIPADVRYDPDLKPNAKLLYGELTSLCNQKGYCWATNEHFSELYGLSVGTVSRLISQLEAKGYIRCEMAATEKGSERRIYAGVFVVEPGGGIDEKRKTPIDENVKGGIDEKRKGGLDENVKQNNKIINNKNTPLPPKGGRARNTCVPKYRADWFERFWALYPRKTNRLRAVQAWDKLKPDLELCKIMSQALKAQINMPQWSDPQHIPHPSTWLNGARWMDEIPQVRAASQSREEGGACGWR